MVKALKFSHGTLKDRSNRKVLLMRLEKIAVLIFRWTLFVGLAYVILYPILYMLSSTFKSSSDVLDPGVVWVPKHFDLTNIKAVYKVMDYTQSFINTVVYAVISAFLQVGITAFVGYGFARFKFKGREILFSIALFTIIVPPQTTIIPMFMKFSNFDVLGIMSLYRSITGSDFTLSIVDTPVSFWLPAIFGMGIRSGLFIYIFRQFFRNMPNELEEAAMIDGCGPYKTFFKIMLPNTGTIFLTASIFSLVWYYNDYYLNNMFAKQHPTLIVSLARLGYNAVDDLSNELLIAVRQQAGCLLVILPPLILYFIVQRKFTQGLERSGIVG